MHSKTIGDLFAEDPQRKERLTREVEVNGKGIYVDYTKTHTTEEDILAWCSKLESMNMAERIHAMFRGEAINYTEKRKVLHVKLRSKNVVHALETETPQGLDVEEAAIYQELLQMKRICMLFQENKLLGASGKPVRNVVGIGIGGSDLGPRLLTSALSEGSSGKCFRYVSNVDAQEMDAATRDLVLEETVFVVVSKTFTTQETLENAKLAVQKVVQAYPPGTNSKDVIQAHFLAVTAAKDKAVEFGVAKENILDMWDYVGGRYSLWSCVSLTSAMAMGFSAFLELLSGASVMDEHFLNMPPRDNLPMLHAMVECKYFNAYGFNNKCVVPYDYYLKLLPSYLQQCEMESNGKSCTKDGKLLLPSEFISSGVPSREQTAGIVWGGLGTDVQHSYFQLLHQGTARVLTEFLIPAMPKVCAPRVPTEGASSSAGASEGGSTAHDVLISNCLAQSRALMLGKSSAEKDRFFSGNRPSITVMYTSLCPFTLGMLISLYEHKIFIQGQVWNINSFDQFGVELGKALAKDILSLLETNAPSPTVDSSLDASTSSLLEWYTKHRQS
ncbi:glucose-6-phosphate isomerase [Nematocida sp. AWRm77]|nr:glucose-6-phosphate isomerase [Nematocida sp. AWRm77]